MLRFNRNSLKNRTFRVLVGNHQSTPRTQQTGIPQGSVLSVTIFLLIMNSIENSIIAPTKSFTFADDKTIYASGNDLDALETEMHSTVDRVVEWAEARGFQFPAEKTKLLHFTRRRSRRTTLMISIVMMHGRRIDQVKVHKILGLNFDDKLSWEPHEVYDEAYKLSS